MRIVWTDTALSRVDEISTHIALDDASAAIRWVSGVFDMVDSQLTAFPESGRIVPELDRTAIRELVYGDYRVFYRVDSCVEVLTVRHCSQMLRSDEVGD